MDYTFGVGSRPRRVIEHHGSPVALRPDPMKPGVAIPDQALVGGARIPIFFAYGDHERLRLAGAEIGKRVGDQGSGFDVNEDDSRFGVPKDDGDGARIEPEVNGVKHGAGHRHGELHFVHRRDVGGDHGHLQR